MRDILDPAHEQFFHSWCTPDTLLAFDYDGTLAPIVEDPARATIRPATRALLSAISNRFDVAVITGRSRRDVLGFLEGLTLVDVIGNHGAETYGSSPRLALDRVAGWQKALHHRLDHHQGVVIEDKGLSLSVHYRRSPDPLVAASAVRAAARDLPGARLLDGKFVLNIVLDSAPDKGGALSRLMARLESPRAVYVGDDETDEDVFRRCSGPEVLRIRIGPASSTAAEWMLEDQDRIDHLLTRFLAGARQRSVTPPSPPR